MSASFSENVRPAGWREISDYARRLGLEWTGNEKTLQAINRDRTKRGLPVYSLVGGKLTAKGMRVA